jgi:hypothetical protein
MILLTTFILRHCYHNLFQRIFKKYLVIFLKLHKDRGIRNARLQLNTVKANCKNNDNKKGTRGVRVKKVAAKCVKSMANRCHLFILQAQALSAQDSTSCSTRDALYFRQADISCGIPGYWKNRIDRQFSTVAMYKFINFPSTY